MPLKYKKWSLMKKWRRRKGKICAQTVFWMDFGMVWLLIWNDLKKEEIFGRFSLTATVQRQARNLTFAWRSNLQTKAFIHHSSFDTKAVSPNWSYWTPTIRFFTKEFPAHAKCTSISGKIVKKHLGRCVHLQEAQWTTMTSQTAISYCGHAFQVTRLDNAGPYFEGQFEMLYLTTNLCH